MSRTTPRPCVRPWSRTISSWPNLHSLRSPLKFAARADAYGTAACLTRAVNQLVLVLFALNRKYPINDKTALAEVAEFERAPREFGPRVQETLVHMGASAAEVVAAVESVAQLLRETIDLADGLYQPRYSLPK